MEKKMARRMTELIAAVCLLAATCSAVGAETHWNLQKVLSTGEPNTSWVGGSAKVTVEGYILNRPEYMLDGTPNYSVGPVGYIGGAWQIYIQGDGNDHAGTAVWMGQNYENMTYVGGIGRYTNEEWLAEIDTLNYDPNTGHRFMPGDKVRVTGLGKFYGGKANIGERHNTNLDNDVIIELVKLGAGLPEPEVITLSQVTDVNSNFIFDQTRLTGSEYYQARLVRINDVNFVDPALWAPKATMTIRDNTGRTFPVYLGIGPGITASSNNLSTQFDIIAIFDQEDSTSPRTGGYRLWVVNYDGNGSVLADGCDLHGVFAPGDINKDCTVNFADFAILAADWLKCSNPDLPECQ